MERVAARETEVVYSSSTTISYGPLPSPAALAAYERASPGLALHIMAMAEDEARHRREIEAQAAAVAVKDAWWKRAERRVGQICAVVFALTCVLVGGWISTSGHPVAGTMFSGTTLVTVVGAFLYGSKEKERDEAVTPGPPTGDLTQPRPPTLANMTRSKQTAPVK